MMRGVSAAKEDVHNAIKNIEKQYLALKGDVHKTNR